MLCDVLKLYVKCHTVPEGSDVGDMSYHAQHCSHDMGQKILSLGKLAQQT